MGTLECHPGWWRKKKSPRVEVGERGGTGVGERQRGKGEERVWGKVVEVKNKK